MRLIRVDKPDLPLEEFNDREIPEYAILSHTWDREEVLFSDLPLNSDQAARKAGYAKIIAFCAETYARGLRYGWVDTCCINKASTTELSEAINSMYKWYAKSTVCIAYLTDYDLYEGNFGESGWFRRGWTLQELIAPRVVEFFDRNWATCGTKANLKTQISWITGIDEQVLGGANPRSYSIAQRMSWAAGRETTRVEDRAYSLLGLFDVALPMIYGTSDTRNAFIALQEEIMKWSDDQSLFAWDKALTETERDNCGFLASSPDAFAGCSNVIRSSPSGLNRNGYMLTNVGLSLDLYTEPYFMRTYVAVLDCYPMENPALRYGILVERLEDDFHYARVRFGNVARVEVEIANDSRIARKICVHQEAKPALKQRYGFWIHSSTKTIVSPGAEEVSIKLFSPCLQAEEVSQGYFMELLPPFAGTVGVLQYMPLDRQHGKIHVEQPVGRHGYRPPKRLDVTNPFQVSEVKLGFDDEFMPVIAISLCDTLFQPSGKCHRQSHIYRNKTARKTLDNDGGLRSQPESTQSLFDNSWIRQADTQRPVHEPRTQYVLKFSGPTKEKFCLGEMVTVTISLSLMPCPPPSMPPCASFDDENAGRIWRLDLTIEERLFNLTHHEAVAFGVQKPCGRETSALVTNAFYRFCRAVAGSCGWRGWIIILMIVSLMFLALSLVSGIEDDCAEYGMCPW